MASPLVAAAASAAGVWATWRLLVGTARGQRIDQIAFEGSQIGAWRIDSQGEALLETVSVPAVAIVVATVTVLALVRRRFVLAIAAPAAVAGANITTQVLKYAVLHRDDLINLGRGALSGNSLPSGHATVAAATVVGLLLVLPRALRPWIAVAGAAMVAAFGFATLVNQWHRPSDVVAAILVAAFWGFLAVAAERLAGRREEPPHPDTQGVVSVLLLLVAILAGGTAGMTGYLLWNETLATASRTDQLIGYAGGVAAVVAAACGTCGVLLRLVDGGGARD